MLNSKLRYMMSNNPNETISVKGSTIRRKIRPFLLKLLALGNKLKLVVDKNNFKKINRPIIYVASHGFKDDVLNTAITLNDSDAYIIFGNIDLFYNTFDGFCLWVIGTQLVDRYDKLSRNTMKEKMNRLMNLGNNIIIFSEATWNLSPNKLMEKLYWGFYDVAMANDAIIVPVVTHKVGKNCYSSVSNAIDIKEINKEDIYNIVNLMNKYIFKAEDLLLYDDIQTLTIKGNIQELKKLILSIKSSHDNQLESIKFVERKAYEYMSLIQVNNEDYLKAEAYKLVYKLIFRISTATKEVMTFKIRDLMATEKYDMLEKHPDYSYMEKGDNMYKAWNSYIQETISATPYFYLEQEKRTLYNDPLISNEEDVMPWLYDKKMIKKK